MSDFIAGVRDLTWDERAELDALVAMHDDEKLAAGFVRGPESGPLRGCWFDPPAWREGTEQG